MAINSKKLTLSAMILALALISFMIESVLPPVFIFAPYVKLGIANVFVVLAALLVGKGMGILVLVAKSLFGGVFGGFFSVYYSLSGGLCAYAVFLLAMRFLTRGFSIVSVSVLMALAHNGVQLLMYCLLTASGAALPYLPISVLVSIPCGAFVGLCVWGTSRILLLREDKKTGGA